MTLTVEEVRSELEKKLEERNKLIAFYEAYYAGQHRLRFAGPKYREAFGNLLKEGADNLCQLVVEVPTERMTIEGFKFGNPELDKKAWEIWQNNEMESEAAQLHVETCKNGWGYILVDPLGDYPTIRFEHPSQMITQCAADDRRRVESALKKWKGNDDHLYSNVYLPEAVYKFRTLRKYRGGAFINLSWEMYDEIPNPLEEVSVVEFQNSPSVLLGGVSDLKSVIPLQDQLNKYMADALIASEYGAFKQKYVLGLDVHTYPEGHEKAGEAIPPDEMRAAASRLWVFEGEDVKVGEFGEVNLNNIAGMVETVIQHISVITRIPPHYVLSQMTNVSAEALIAAETSMTSKVKGKMRDYGRGWKEVLRLSLKSMDVEVTAKPDIDWRNPQKESLVQLADALVKLGTAGWPIEKLYEMGGHSPAEIEQMKKLLNLPERDAPDVSPDGAVPPAPVVGAGVAE